MVDNVIADIILRVESPIIVKQKRGKGAFYKTLPHVPASSVIGAIGRRVIIEKARAALGKCAGISDVNNFPDCDTCDEKTCDYRRIVKENAVKINDFYVISGDLPGRSSGLEVPPVPRLSTLFTRRDASNHYVDFLLHMFLQEKMQRLHDPTAELSRTVIARFKELSRKKPITEYKRTKATCAVKGASIETFMPLYDHFAHCAIDYKLGSTKESMLYFSQGLRAGTVLRSFAIGPDDLVDRLAGPCAVGMGKSRGFGRVSISVAGKKQIEQYVRDRSKQIKEGFDAIMRGLRLNDGIYYGTFTGLSPLPIPDDDLIELERDAGSAIKNLASARLGIPREEIVTCKGTIGHGVRFDGQSTSLVSEPVLQAGYCGVLALENVDDNACLTLARKEVEIPGNAGWYGFVYVNHPVHASTLTDEG